MGAHAAAGLLMGGGARAANSRFRTARPPVLSWALPAIVLVELTGSTSGAPLVFSALFFVGVLAALFSRKAPCGPARSRRWRRVSGGFALSVGVAGVWLALPHTGAPPLLLDPDVRLALAGAGSWGVAVGVAWCAARRASFRDLERFGWLVAACFAWLLAHGHRVQRLAVLPDGGPARAVALIAVGVLLGLAATAGRWHVARLGLLLSSGLVLRVLGLGVWHPDPSVRDMLPLVQAAGDALVNGESPYGLYAMQRGSVVPLTYLPGLWLLHGLPGAVGLPLRTTSLLADATIVLSLWWAASGFSGLERWRARCLALALSAVWLWSPSVHWNAIYAEPHPYWGVLALLFAATLRGRFTLAAVLLGVAIATRQFAWVLAPFWLLLAVRQMGFARALEKLSIAGAVALVLIVPFVAAAPDWFWFGTLRWFADYGPAHRTWFLTRLGFAGSFYAAHLESWLIPLQATAAVLGFGLALKTATSRALVAVTAASYTLVIMLCPVIWSSFYLGCFIVLGMAVLVSSETSANAPRPRLAQRYWLPLALESAALGWLVYGFWSAVSAAGLAQARSALVQGARAGDVLVDRGEARVAFVQPPLFEAPASIRVVASEFDASLAERGVLGAPRVGLVFRESRDRALARGMEQLGPVVDRGRSGDYGWLLVEPTRVMAPLLAGLSGGSFRTQGRVFPLEPSAERGLTPRIPSAIHVRETDCLVAGRSRRMLFAHPSDQGALELAFVAPTGARRLVLLAGFDDRVVRWGRAEANLRVSFGDVSAGELRVRNLPGVQWQVFSLQPGSARHAKLALTTSDERQRWLCLDGAWQ